MEKVMKKLLWLVCLVPLVGFAQSPNVVKLQGKVVVDSLVIDEEEPLSDELDEELDEGVSTSYRVLQLARAQTLAADDLAGGVEYVSGVQKIQLAGAKIEQIYKLPVDSNVEMTCDLFKAHTAYHYTDVLCDVKSFKLLKNSKVR